MRQYASENEFTVQTCNFPMNNLEPNKLVIFEVLTEQLGFDMHLAMLYHYF